MKDIVQAADREVKFMTGRGGKYLTFSLAAEEYGISILTVKEIIGMMAITMIPQIPAYVKGVINLRGKVIPVVDSVSEVLNIKPGEIEDTPTFGARMDTDYILGMAKMEGSVKILLDIDRVLSDRDFHDVAVAA